MSVDAPDSPYLAPDSPYLSHDARSSSIPNLQVLTEERMLAEEREYAPRRENFFKKVVIAISGILFVGIVGTAIGFAHADFEDREAEAPKRPCGVTPELMQDVEADWIAFRKFKAANVTTNSSEVSEGTTATTTEEQERMAKKTLSKFVNLELLGRGYDIYFGNPLSQGIDPGIKGQNVFDIIHHVDAHGFPIGIEATPGLTCSLDFTSELIYGKQGYKYTIEKSIGLSSTYEFNVPSGAFPGKFSASFGWGNVKESTEEFSRVLTVSDASCEAYRASILPPREWLGPNSLAQLHSNFATMVEWLPTIQESMNEFKHFQPQQKAKYLQMLEVYGTHVLMENVVMGSRYGSMNEFTSEGYFSFADKSWSITTSASLTAFAQAVGLDKLTKSQIAQTEAVKDERTMHSEYSVGSRLPVAQGDGSKWASQTGTDPLPIAFDLVSLADIIENFSAFPEKATPMREVLKDYCHHLQHKGIQVDCEQPTADPVPTRIPLPTYDVLVHMAGHGDQTVHGAEYAGTRGRRRQLEGFQVSWVDAVEGVELEYMGHIAKKDSPWTRAGSYVGSRGSFFGSKLEGVAFRLVGKNAALYRVRVLIHMAGYEDKICYFHTRKEPALCGTRGEGRRLEGLQVWIERRGGIIDHEETDLH
jgi:hypothetical protein